MQINKKILMPCSIKIYLCKQRECALGLDTFILDSFPGLIFKMPFILEKTAPFNFNTFTHDKIQVANTKASFFVLDAFPGVLFF
jgi:hypothetical protein